MDWAMISAIAEASAAVLAGVAIYMAVSLQKRQMLLERRQLLLPLWDHLRKLPDVNPSEPVWMDVVTAVNSLELIAVCWEGQLIDEDIIRRMYGDLYIDIYEKVLECKNPPKNVAKDGKGMLHDSPATINLYNQLMRERVDRNKLSGL